MYTLSSVTNDFISHCRFEKNLSPKTIKAYKNDLNQLSVFLLSKKYPMEISKIGKIQLREYLEFMSPLKPKSIKRKIATIKAMFNYLEYEDTIETNPLRKMRINIKEQMTLPRVLNINQMADIFKSAYEQKNLNLVEKSYSYFKTMRNIIVIELLFATGARVSELANLMDSMIDVNSGEITIQGKGNRERIIQVCNKETIQILKTYRKEFLDKINLSGGFFLVNRLNKMLSDQSIRTIIKELSLRAKVQMQVTPHTFRHSFATLLLEKDVDIKYIQSLLGHSSIMTTQIYTHVNREKQKQILKTKHPRKDFSFQVNKLP